MKAKFGSVTTIHRPKTARRRELDGPSTSVERLDCSKSDYRHQQTDQREQTANLIYYLIAVIAICNKKEQEKISLERSDQASVAIRANDRNAGKEDLRGIKEDYTPEYGKRPKIKSSAGLNVEIQSLPIGVKLPTTTIPLPQRLFIHASSSEDNPTTDQIQSSSEDSSTSSSDTSAQTDDFDGSACKISKRRIAGRLTRGEAEAMRRSALRQNRRAPIPAEPKHDISNTPRIGKNFQREQRAPLIWPVYSIRDDQSTRASRDPVRKIAAQGRRSGPVVEDLSGSQSESEPEPLINY